MLTAEGHSPEDTITDDPRAEADQILANAKAEAVALLTHAKKVSEKAVAEADHEAAVMRQEAETILETARKQADALMAEVQEEKERLLEMRATERERIQAEIERENAELLDHMRRLRAVVSDLEVHLNQVARGALDELTGISSTLRKSLAVAPSPSGPDGGTSIGDRVKAAREGTSEAVDEGEAGRGSFYSRRSARLPRIGAEAASGALASVSAMRTKSSGGDSEASGEPAPDDASE